MRRKPNPEADILQGYAESLKETNEKLFDLLSEANSEIASVHELLGRVQDANRELERELIELRKLTPVPYAPASGPLYTTEAEEDAQWQLDNGLIGKEAYQAILQEAGLTNTEIEID